MVSAITYYCTLPFLYLLSLLPFPVLYFLSDCVYVLLFYVVGYRKEIVFKNLQNSFPKKTEVEIKKLHKEFYHYFCDLFLETFKTLTISKKQMLKHCSMKTETLQLFQQLHHDKKSIMLVMGHYGNWEWAGNTFSLLCKHQLYVIYHPLSNKYFDGLMYQMRTRFGTKLIAMRDTFKAMVANKNEISATAFIADQTPQPDNAYWTTFLNQDTPVFWGTERIAKKLNYPIVYISVQKIKRGYYTLHAELLELTPELTADCEISEKHTKRLEEDIILQPSTWLWTHKRWKHKKN
ncbi:MAG: lysophospholipid acyltransferase family protein [Bacteroidetes bacterium]|nr:lysophospholipid acyltransferase family protein [Bacteroidota bacterium]MBS1649375.1 lysophospholipid acyltransferase family protein [Bacteroidota bacterium]